MLDFSVGYVEMCFIVGMLYVECWRSTSCIPGGNWDMHVNRERGLAGGLGRAFAAVRTHARVYAQRQRNAVLAQSAAL